MGTLMGRLVLALCITLAAIELGARWGGFGSPLLYETTGYGYRVVPGQSLVRLGKRVIYNEYGLRNEAIPPLPPPGTLRILCVGDSITFGGTLTDQAQTWPALLAQMLTDAGRQRRFEALNASAGGWALENEEGWLATNGTFGASWIVLQVASHDLFQEKTGSAIVGTHPAFPDRAPALALLELGRRYLTPRIAAAFQDPGQVVYSRTAQDVERNLGSITRIVRYAREHGARVVVAFVEQPRGLEPQDDIARISKQMLAARLRSLAVPLVSTADALDAQPGVPLFRDAMHPNEAGNRVIADTLARQMSAWIGDGARTP